MYKLLVILFVIKLYARNSIFNGKNVINFGTDMSSFVHVDNKNKNILNLGDGPTQRLHDTPLRTEAKYPINFTQQRKGCIKSTL